MSKVVNDIEEGQDKWKWIAEADCARSCVAIIFAKMGLLLRAFEPPDFSEAFAKIYRLWLGAKEIRQNREFHAEYKKNIYICL